MQTVETTTSSSNITSATLITVNFEVMDLKDFKLVKNRQRPDLCYAYEKKTLERNYTIFTMDSGKTFLASVQSQRLDKQWYSEFSETHNSVNECLNALSCFNNI